MSLLTDHAARGEVRVLAWKTRGWHGQKSSRASHRRFLCEPIGEVSPQPGADVMEVGFFELEELPPLSMSRTITDDVTAAFASRNESSGLALFD